MNYLRLKGKTVTIACSTGIASTHYGKLGGTTLHKWSGIGDDRYLNEEIVHLIKTDERFNDVKDNVQSTNTHRRDINDKFKSFRTSAIYLSEIQEFVSFIWKFASNFSR